MRWRSRVRSAATALATALATVSGWLATSVKVLAASPTPTAAAGGDPRSAGEGPGLVGDPLLAILVVVAIGAASLVVTLVYVRATRDPRAG